MMFDIGLGEIVVLAVIALIVFGPDQLPKAAASVGRFARQMREMASSARAELGDSAGLDGIGEDLKSLRDLHPKRIIASAFEEPTDVKPSDQPQPPPGSKSAAGASGATAAGGAASGGAAAKAADGYDPDAT